MTMRVYRPTSDTLLRLMMNQCLTPLATLVIVALIHSSVHGATQQFFVKQATYSGEHGAFRCEAKLEANDDATLVLKVPEAQRDEVLRSIHTSLPAKISSSGASDVVISIAVSSDVAVTAGVTFVNKMENTHNFKYGIELSSGILQGYLQVFDRSGSSANWSDAKLLIHDPAGDFCLIANMDAEQSLTAPVKKFADYKVTVAEQTYLRSKGDSAFRVSKLTNNGSERLPRGEVNVMDSGDFLYRATISANLASQASIDLLTKSIDSNEVSFKSDDRNDQWLEAVSLTDGILNVQRWSVKETRIENKTAQKITLFVEDSTNSIDVNANSVEKVVKPLKAEGTRIEANLFELSEAKLELHTTRLKQIRVFPATLNPKKISAIVEQQGAILRATKDLTKANASKTATETILTELTAAGAPPATLNLLVERLKDIQEKIAKAEQAKANATTKLVRLLFS